MSSLYSQTVGQQREISTSREIYPHSKFFQEQIDLLEKDFGGWRMSRGDGNCYYRSVACSLIEHFCRPTTPVEEVKAFIQRLDKDPLFQPAAAQLRFDDRYLKQDLRELCRLKEESGDIKSFLKAKLAEVRFDIDMIKLLRSIACNFLTNNPKHPDLFELYEIMYDYTMNMTSAMGTEAEGLTFFCIAESLSLSIHHIVLSNENAYNKTQIFNPSFNGRFPMLYIWFRTGHYDVLYSKKQYEIDTNPNPRVTADDLYFIKGEESHQISQEADANQVTIACKTFLERVLPVNRFWLEDARRKTLINLFRAAGENPLVDLQEDNSIIATLNMELYRICSRCSASRSLNDQYSNKSDTVCKTCASS